MQEGYLLDTYSNEIPSAFDFGYAIGLRGIDRMATFPAFWEKITNIGHGIVHQPILTEDDDIYDNASSMLWLCQETQGFNSMPIIVDIFYASGNARLNFDHLRIYAGYVEEHFSKGTKKPLIRVNKATWINWYNTNPVEAGRLLNKADILLAQYGVDSPDELPGVERIKYWEHEEWKILYNESGDWGIPPEPPEQPEPPEPPEEPEPPTAPVKKWRVNLTVSGVIEAIE